MFFKTEDYDDQCQELVFHRANHDMLHYELFPMVILRKDLNFIINEICTKLRDCYKHVFVFSLHGYIISFMKYNFSF